MIQLITGNKGKGKTTELLNKVNADVQEKTGNIVYIDKNTKHMYELNNKIRLINISEFPIENSNEFIGFVLGIISQDHDLQEICLDNFLILSHLDDNTYMDTLKKLREISEKYNLTIVCSLAIDGSLVPEEFKQEIIISL